MSIHTTQQTSSIFREEWYTPNMYMQDVKSVIGAIDLDPCSCEYANRTVQAKSYITREQNALQLQWDKVITLYANPPYSTGVISKFVNCILQHYAANGFQHGIILINNVSDTKYWQHLAATSAMFCSTNHRIAFVDKNGNRQKANTRGQTIFLLSNTVAIQKKFVQSFAKYGVIATCIPKTEEAGQ